MRWKYILTFIFCFTLNLQAIEVETEELPFSEPYVPWFTGPLLAPSGDVVPPGSLNIEPYVFITAFTGTYTPQWKSQAEPLFWSYTFTVPIQFGIVPRVDFTASPRAFYNKTQGKHSWGIGDLTLSLGLQLFQETTYIPNMKLAFQEILPTGNFNSLDLENLLTDGMGGGSYVSTIGFVASKLIQIKKFSYLNMRMTTAYSFPSAVHLKGISSYGGNPFTKGSYHPAKILTFDLGLEYSFSRNWAWAVDVLYTYGTKSSFHGKNGEGLFSNLGGELQHTTSQISLAPAIEYSWGESLGLIAGCWLSIAGSNCSVFRTGAIALNYYYK